MTIAIYRVAKPRPGEAASPERYLLVITNNERPTLTLSDRTLFGLFHKYQGPDIDWADAETALRLRGCFKADVA